MLYGRAVILRSFGPKKIEPKVVCYVATISFEIIEGQFPVDLSHF